jgi:muramidase (phage lysozyme)
LGGLVLKRPLIFGLAIASLLYALWKLPNSRHLLPRPYFMTYLPPLVMEGGDPYIRALMRTISASEANSPQPYSILYGGNHTTDLSRHPDRCITIVAGPNEGNCTTAAGRYQFITSTWMEKSERYHPQPSQFLFWESYSFEPQFQDAVVYAWLSDPKAWGVDISQRLRQGELKSVLSLLSGTWTSLGYGLESNLITPSLPDIYHKMLQEELRSAWTPQSSYSWQSGDRPRHPNHALGTNLEGLVVESDERDDGIF